MVDVIVFLLSDQNTQISSRTLNTPYEIFMVVSIVFVIALIILAVIGYLYVGELLIRIMK